MAVPSFQRPNIDGVVVPRWMSSDQIGHAAVSHLTLITARFLQSSHLTGVLQSESQHEETMSHVQPLSVSEAPPEARDLLSAIEERYGQVLNIFGTMAHQPDVLKGVATVNDGIQRDLPGKLRELAYYAASQLNDCQYCSHYHRKAAIKSGLTDKQLDSILDSDGNDLFSPVEKLVIAYSKALTEEGHVVESTIEQLKSHLDERQLVTLAATVALANFTNRFNHGLGVKLP